MTVVTRKIAVGNGMSLAVTERHPGASRTLIFLHGYLDQSRSFDGLCEALSPSWRMLQVDWRGHGDSDAVGRGGSYHLVDHVKDLDGLLRALDVKDAVIVGHSMGGNVAALHAGSVGGHLRGLVLLETLGPPAEEQNLAPTRLKDALVSRRSEKPTKMLASPDEAVARLRTTNPGLSVDGATRMAEHALRPVEGGWTWKFHPAVQGPPPQRFTDEGVCHFLRNISVPVLLVRADNGYVPPRPSSPERYDAIANLTIVEVKDMHHHVHVDAIAAVAAALSNFLSTLD